MLKSNADNESPYLKSPLLNFRQRFLAMSGLCFVMVMVAIDQTVVGIALPTVVAELKGFSLYAWVGTSYLLTSVITIPILGRLGDDYGRKPFVLIAIVLFVTASMLCGLSQSMLQLVLSRALQGIGGGMLVATAFASIPDLFPDSHERLRWQVLFSSAFGLANAVGPSLGGFLTEHCGWRWVFFVNLPVGILGALFIWLYFPRIRNAEKSPSKLDWLGALLIALVLGCMQLFTEWLPQNKPTFILITLALLAIASALILFFWEKRCPNPILPLEMFTHRSLQPLFLLSLMMGFCMFAVMYYTPLMFQGGFNLSPNQAGMLITPFAVSITLGSLLNGRVLTHLRSPNLMLYIGFVLFLISVIGLTQIWQSTPHWMIILIMTFGGLGLGLLMPNLTIFTQETAPRAQLGIATAMLQSTRMIGGMLGTALIGTLIRHQYIFGLHSLLKTNDKFQIWLNDPQILVNHQRATQFAATLKDTDINAASLLEMARVSLVTAIHYGQWVILIVMVLAFLVVPRIPPLQLKRR